MEGDDGLRTSTRTRIAAAAIAAITVLSMLNTLQPTPAIAWALGALAFAAAVAARGVVRPGIARVSLLILLGCALVTPFAPRPLASLERGLSLGGTLVALVASVSLLSSMAIRNPSVQRVAQRLTALSGRRRYIGFSLAAQLFGGTLGLAGSTLLMHVAGNEAKDDPVERLATFLAITRSFAGACMWSPLVSNTVIMLALYPGMTWLHVLPTMLALSGVAGAASYLVQRKRLVDAPSERTDGAPPWLGVLRPVLLVAGAFLGFVLGASSALHISVSAVIVLLAPIASSAAAMARSASGRRLADAAKELRANLAQLPRLAGEVMLFMASACAGSVVADATPRAWTALVAAPLTQAPELACLALILWVVVLSFTGIHPVMSAVYIATALPAQALALSQLAHLAAILVGWSIAGTVTPFSIGAMMASRYSGISIYRLSLAANAAFATLSIAASALFLGAIARLA